MKLARLIGSPLLPLLIVTTLAACRTPDGSGVRSDDGVAESESLGTLVATDAVPVLNLVQGADAVVHCISGITTSCTFMAAGQRLGTLVAADAGPTFQLVQDRKAAVHCISGVTTSCSFRIATPAEIQVATGAPTPATIGTLVAANAVPVFNLVGGNAATVRCLSGVTTSCEFFAGSQRLGTLVAEQAAPVFGIVQGGQASVNCTSGVTTSCTFRR